MILTAFFKALSQLPDPRFQRVLWLGVGLTLALLVGAYLLILGVIGWFVSDPVSLPWIGEVTWIDNLLGWGSLFGILIASVFLMIPIASAITSLFLDTVAEAVEDAHYLDLPHVAPTSIIDGLRDSIGFLGVLVGANLVALIGYVLLPFAAPFIFYGLNGYLLGREYFQVAAMRRLGRTGAQALRKQHMGTIWAAGILMALPLSIPLVNLFVPIIGAATFTHLYHRITRTAGLAGPSG
ncbi:hypothetical protein AN189_11840 [Loktanella sp. 3ANDIMAR09]|uniref:EI24 domain-containing protein n=1 Tax=Loktanella sp. 3ANDIMAR09 TaxID=1225657 RepID=UPI0006FE5E1C|nr:EI24 domain-containing protein [Loktanella sp. 3ANDIMAR09]KQI68099.1 hypothetical protein AN189_11840 [Loktanella sp. 3ANDIMAR09]